MNKPKIQDTITIFLFYLSLVGFSALEKSSSHESLIPFLKIFFNTNVILTSITTIICSYLILTLLEHINISNIFNPTKKIGLKNATPAQILQKIFLE